MRKLSKYGRLIRTTGPGTTENGHRYVRNLKLNILGIVINLSDFPEDFGNKPFNFTESDEIGMNLFLDITGSHEQQDYELGIGVGLEKMADLHLEGHFSNVPIEIFEFEKYDDSELRASFRKGTKIGVVKLLARYDERGFLSTRWVNSARSLVSQKLQLLARSVNSLKTQRLAITSVAQRTWPVS